MITKPNYAFEMHVIQPVSLHIRFRSINHRRATAAAASAPVHMDPLPKVEGWPFVSTVSAVVEVGADDAAGVGVPVIWPEQMSATEVDASGGRKLDIRYPWKKCFLRRARWGTTYWIAHQGHSLR